MNPITPLPAFAPLAPPPAPRILSIYATDLSARPSRRLIANEDLPLKPSHFHPYQSSSLSPQTHTGQLPHTSQSSKSRVSHAASDRNLTPLSSLSPTPVRNMSPTSDQTSDLSKVEGPRRYPHRIISSAGTSGTSAPAPRITLLPAKKVRLERPKGAGRSNLPQLLGWDDSLHEAIKAATRQSIVRHLTVSLSIKSQDEKKLAQVREEVVKEYPVLEDYTDAWPLDIIIARLLKYLSSHQKNKGMREAVGRLQTHK